MPLKISKSHKDHTLVMGYVGHHCQFVRMYALILAKVVFLHIHLYCTCLISCKHTEYSVVRPWSLHYVATTVTQSGSDNTCTIYVRVRYSVVCWSVAVY